jgi:hypothetical protein
VLYHVIGVAAIKRREFSTTIRRKSRATLLLLDFLAFVSFIPHRQF